MSLQSEAAERASRKKQRLENFRYQALAANGQSAKGSIKAINQVRAYTTLMEQGYTDINLQPVPSPFSLEGAFPSMFKVKPLQVAVMCQQLATLLESGVSLLPAIQLLGSQSTYPPPLRRILNHITSDLSVGDSLSQSLARHPQVFDEIFVRTLEVGERTGRLEVVLREISTHIENKEAFGKKLKGAMTYPIIILVVGIVVSFLLITVVLPPLAKLFVTLGTKLPLPTRILMGISGFFAVAKLYLIGAIVLFVVGMVTYGRSPAGRKLKDRLAIKMPVLGGAAYVGEIARLARTMSLMLTAGLSLQDTVEMLPRTSTNSIFREALQEVRQGLFLGQGFSFTMAANSLFPPLLLQMAKVGEDTNTLDRTMRVAANFYESVAEDKTAAIVSLITPLSTIFLAGLVAFVALSVIMPIYGITAAVGG